MERLGVQSPQKAPLMRFPHSTWMQSRGVDHQRNHIRKKIWNMDKEKLCWISFSSFPKNLETQSLVRELSFLSSSLLVGSSYLPSYYLPPSGLTPPGSTKEVALPFPFFFSIIFFFCYLKPWGIFRDSGARKRITKVAQPQFSLFLASTKAGRCR